MTKIIYTLLFIFLSFNSLTQKSFQPLKEADWSFNRIDHQLHYFGSIGLTMVVAGFSTYKDIDNPNIKNGLKWGGIVGGGVAVGKELIIDNLFNLGAPTYPDLFYGLAGVAVGLVTVLLITKFDIWYKNKYYVNR